MKGRALCGGCAGGEDIHDWTLTLTFHRDAGRVVGETEEFAHEVWGVVVTTCADAVGAPRSLIRSEHTTLEATREHDAVGRLLRVVYRDPAGAVAKEVRTPGPLARSAADASAAPWKVAAGGRGSRA